MAKIVKDEWLSKQIRKKAFRMEGEPEGEELAEPPSFIYTKIDSTNVALVSRYTKLGFYPVDCALALRQKFVSVKRQEIQSGVVCRHALPEDEQPVAEIARTAFCHSRFHLDPRFSKETADRIKKEWVRNFFLGQRGDRLWVATCGAELAGFSLMLKREPNWVIDLIAVAPRFQGRGIGRTLIATLNRDLGCLDVGTQVSNASSLALYQAAGFSVVSSSYVLHFHNNALTRSDLSK